MFYSGLKYLHDSSIAHGDIHAGNVLIFKEDGDIVAKWTDFGLAFVSGKGEYIFNSKAKSRKTQRMLAKRIEKDCKLFANILTEIWKNRKREKEHDHVRQLCDRYTKIIDALKNVKNLDQILVQFKDILVYNERLV